MATWAIAMGGVAVGLTGCAGGAGAIRPRLAPVDARALASGRAIAEAAVSPAAAMRTAWWQQFGDSQLDRLLDSEVRAAPTIEMAAARLRIADAMYEGSRAAEQPRVDVQGSATGERFPDHWIYGPPYAGNWGSEGALQARFHHALDFWGRRRQQSLAARAGTDAARAEADDAMLWLRTAIAQAYLRLDLDYRLRDIVAEGLERRQRLVGLFDTRQHAGLAAAIETVPPREAASVTSDELERLDAGIARERHRIAALLGRDPDFADRLSRPAVRPVDAIGVPGALPADLLGKRPDVAAARATVEAAAHRIGVARAAFYPDVDLAAFAGVQSLGLAHLLRSGSIGGGGGAAFSLPLFDAGRLRAELRGRTAGYDAAVADYQAVLTQALREVADGVVMVRAEQGRLAEARSTVRLWTMALSQQQLRQAHGLSDGIEQMAVETSLLLARRRTAEAAGRLVEAQVALIRALGGGWSSGSMESGGR